MKNIKLEIVGDKIQSWRSSAHDPHSNDLEGGWGPTNLITTFGFKLDFQVARNIQQKLNLTSLKQCSWITIS